MLIFLLSLIQPLNTAGGDYCDRESSFNRMLFLSYFTITTKYSFVVCTKVVE